MTDDEKPDNLDAIYPVGEKDPDRVRTRNGRPLSDLILDNLLAGHVAASDFGITADGLRLQAAIAELAGRPNLAQNLRRGAELVEIPDNVLLDVYELLRPGRAQSADDLRAAADQLRNTHGAKETASLLEEAALVYERRGIFQRRFRTLPIFPAEPCITDRLGIKCCLPGWTQEENGRAMPPAPWQPASWRGWPCPFQQCQRPCRDPRSFGRKAIRL